MNKLRSILLGENDTDTAAAPSPIGGEFSINDLVESESAKYGLDSNVVKALIGTESGGRPGATSYLGAGGLMQIMPDTAREIAQELGEEYSDEKRYDPATNVRWGTYYLAKKLKKYGSYPLALAAYHGGDGAIRKDGTISPTSNDGYMYTTDYSDKIMKDAGRGYELTGTYKPKAKSALRAILDAKPLQKAKPEPIFAQRPQTRIKQVPQVELPEDVVNGEPKQPETADTITGMHTTADTGTPVVETRKSADVRTQGTHVPFSPLGVAGQQPLRDLSGAVPEKGYRLGENETGEVVGVPIVKTEEDAKALKEIINSGKLTDDRKIWGAIKHLGEKEKQDFIKSLDPAMRKLVNNRKEMEQFASPTLGGIVRTGAAGLDWLAESTFSPEARDRETKQYYEQAKPLMDKYGITVDDFRGENGKIDPMKIGPVMKKFNVETGDYSRIKNYVDSARWLERAPERYKEFKGKAEEFKETADILDPWGLKREKMIEQIDSWKESDRGIIEAWNSGGLSFAISQAIADAMLSGDEERIQQAIELRKKFREGFGKKESDLLKGNWGYELLRETSRMLNPLVKTGIKMAVPVVGQAWGTYEWARQGMGDVYADMREAGVSHQTAAELAPATGLVYALVEKAQVGKLANIGSKISGTALKQALLKLAIEKGKDFVTELTEEGAQRLITDISAELGKQIDGVSQKEVAQVLAEAGQGMLEEMKAAAGPLALLSLFGFSAGAVQKTGEFGNVSTIVGHEGATGQAREVGPPEAPPPQESALGAGVQAGQEESPPIVDTDKETIPEQALPQAEGEDADTEDIGVDTESIKELVGTTEEVEPEEAIEIAQIESEKQPLQEISEEEFKNLRHDEISYDQFKELSPEQQRVVYESNPVTGKPGQRAFIRRFNERTEGQSKPVIVGMIDINGFKKYNDTFGTEFTDEVNRKFYDITSKYFGVEDHANLHGDEHAVFGDNVEDLHSKAKAAANELAQTENMIQWPDGKERPITFKMMIGQAKNFREAGNINPKKLGPNQIFVDKSIPGDYTVDTLADNAKDIVSRDMEIKPGVDDTINSIEADKENQKKTSKDEVKNEERIRQSGNVKPEKSPATKGGQSTSFREVVRGERREDGPGEEVTQDKSEEAGRPQEKPTESEVKPPEPDVTPGKPTEIVEPGIPEIEEEVSPEDVEGAEILRRHHDKEGGVSVELFKNKAGKYGHRIYDRDAGETYETKLYPSKERAEAGYADVIRWPGLEESGITEEKLTPEVSEAKKKARDETTQNINPKAVESYDNAVEEAITKGDEKSLNHLNSYVLNLANRKLRKLWEEDTGIKLGRTYKKNKELIREWINSQREKQGLAEKPKEEPSKLKDTKGEKSEPRVAVDNVDSQDFVSEPSAKYGTAYEEVDGGIKIKDVDAIPMSRWKVVSTYMNRKGYDYRGAQDAKMLFKRQEGGTIFGDQADAIRVALEAKKAKTKEEKLQSKAVRYFGYTTIPRSAGYIAPNGKMLDFSGQKQGSGTTERSLDHRDVSQFVEREDIKSGTASMQYFQSIGNIRMHFPGTFDIIGEPTKEQYLTIAKIVALSKNEPIVIDLQKQLGKINSGGEYFGSNADDIVLEYDEGVSPQRVIRDIRNYFSGSQKGQSLVQQFHVSEDRLQYKLNLGLPDGNTKPEDFGFTQEEIKTIHGSTENAKKTNREVAKQLDKFEQQTDLFEYQKPVRMRGRPERLLPERYKGVPGEWKRHKRIDFTNHIINDASDLAQLFTAYRHPRLEHFHLVYVDKSGRILGHNAISSGTANATLAFQFAGREGSEKSIKRLRSRMKRLNADGYYLLHNHPSGTMIASRPDIQVTKIYKDFVPGFKGHVIIDGDKFVFIDNRLDKSINPLKRSLDVYNKGLPVIKNKFAVADVTKEVLGKDEDKSVAVITNNNNEVVSLIPLYTKKQHGFKYVYQKVREEGGIRAFIISNSKDKYTQMVSQAVEARQFEGGRFNTIEDVIFSDDKTILSARDKQEFGSTKERPFFKKYREGKGGFLFETGEKYEPEFSEVEAIEKEARKLQGKLIHVSKELVAERANIQVEINKYKNESRDKIMSLIIDYAKKIGLRGEPYNRVDTLLKNTRTVRGLQKAVNIMDEVMQKRVRSRLYEAVQKKVKSEYLRLKRITGKSQSTQSLEANRRLKSYLDNLTSVTDKKKEKLEKSLNWFLENPEKEMPKYLKDEVAKLFKRNLSEMDNSELTKVLEDIAHIKKEGKLKFELQEERRKLKLAIDAAKAKAEILEGTKPKPVSSAFLKAVEEVGKKKTIGDIVKNYGWGHIRPETMFEKIANWKKGVFKENTFNKILSAENTKLVNMEKASKAVEGIHSGIDVGESMKNKFIDFKYKYPGTEKVETIPLTLNNMMSIYANSLNPGNRAHLAGTGITDPIIDEITSKLPEKYKNAVDKMVEYFDNEQYQRVNEVFSKDNLIDMPKEHNYFPIQNIDSKVAENQIVADMIARYSSKYSSVQKGFTKSRVASAAAFKKLDYFGTIINHINSSEHYIAYNQAVKDVSRFLNDESLKSAIVGKSEAAYSQMKDWLNAVAYGRLKASNNPVDQISDWLRTNYVTSVLGFNVVTALKQPASFSQGLAHVSKVEAARTIAKFLRGIKNEIKKADGSILKFVTDKSPMMRNRANSFERELVEMVEKGGAKRQLGVEGWTEKLKEQSMKPIQYCDMVTTSILWYSKYQEGVGLGKANDTAIADADELIRKTQPMGGIVHLSAIYRGGGLARAYTMFTNQLNQNLNRVYELADRWGEQKTLENAEKVFFYTVLPSALLYAASNGLRAPWRDPEGWAKAFISNLTGGLMLINRIVDSLMSAITSKTKRMRGEKPRQMVSDLMPPSLSALTDAQKNIQRAFGKNPQKAIEPTISMFAKFYGIPYTQIKRTAKGAKMAVETEDLRYLIWSEYALDE